MPTGDITKRKFEESQPGSKGSKARIAQKQKSPKIDGGQSQRAAQRSGNSPAERVIPGGFHAHGHNHLP